MLENENEQSENDRQPLFPKNSIKKAVFLAAMMLEGFMIDSSFVIIFDIYLCC